MKSLLSNDGDSITPTLISILNNTIDVESINWETKLAILELAGTLSAYNQDESLNFVAKKAIQWLSDEEVRVRMASGEYLGILCTVFGPSIYENYKTVVIELIREHIERALKMQLIMSTLITTPLIIFISYLFLQHSNLFLHEQYQIQLYHQLLKYLCIH